MKAGKRARFEELYWRHHRELAAFIRRRVPPDAVEDVLAEVFVVAWRRLSDIPVEARAWLYGVARNVIRNTYRAEARQRALHVRIAEEAGSAPAHTDSFDDAIASRTDLGRAWNQLSETEQEVIALVAWDGLSNAESAQVLGVTTSAFAVRLFRARRRLLHLLERSTGGAR
ncbi:MAG TPA: sigma-70 family RNA polymerase sigma factor [Actinotalea caeni]|uniref:RNA polymerase sigma factor n=1 Tax=Actinotalea caeni TaxID=1348467 RepID=UPI002B4ADC31|nr:sigma-70 family RNA polymerase sigma factor [Actinotalea caeni]HLV54538.1 sigma-70 family RNA polymerase sigma factor [Actinotalea caeni]